MTERTEGALASGLISGPTDSRTTIFFGTLKRCDATGAIAALTEWIESVGLALEYGDGALEREWQSAWDGGYSRFTEWVDAEAERREVAVEERIKRLLKR